MDTRSYCSVSVPGKLALFGEYGPIFGGHCLVTVVSCRLKVAAKKSERNLISAPDVGLLESALDETLDIPKEGRYAVGSLRTFARNFGIDDPVRIETSCGFSPSYGLGSSSAVIVGVMKALAELFEVNLPNESLFGLSYNTEVAIQGRHPQSGRPLTSGFTCFTASLT